ncbi:uncharacterized protein C1orf21 homolog isoform X3 [Trichomycterus rosablanca]|uniref:uncharacterized protein C1orf21 homolog isoform X3 n=1 Tax=Trichomycterus rosablanca TaxID=2290929 RepID=UPI002F35BE83
MGCASAKQLSSVPGDEEDREKAHSNGDAFSSDEYKMKGVEKVKYLHGEEERMNTRNQEHLEKSTFLHKVSTPQRASRSSSGCWTRKSKRVGTTAQRRRT